MGYLYPGGTVAISPSPYTVYSIELPDFLKQTGVSPGDVTDSLCLFVCMYECVCMNVCVCGGGQIGMHKMLPVQSHSNVFINTSILQ